MIADTLLVVAGPRGCGKSTFIASCRRDAALTRNAPELSKLFERGPKTIPLTQIKRHEKKVLELAILHVDILSPFDFAPTMNGADLKEYMTADRFAGFEGTDVMRGARELYAVTLSVPRGVTLRRWLNRKAMDGSKFVAANLARILSEAAEDDQLYAHLYAVWHEFIGAVRPKRHWRATERKEGYAIDEITNNALQ